MNTTRVLGAALMATTVALAACGNGDDNNGTGTSNTATVRFVNATGQNLDIGTNGTFQSANSNLAFGASSQCLTVNPSSAGLTFRQNGTATTFMPTGFNAGNLTAGGTYTVLLRPGATNGTYTSTMLTDSYSGATTSAGGVRVINATTGATNYGLYVGPAGATMPSTATNASFGAGATTAFVPINIGNGQVWLTTGSGGSTTTAFSSNPFAVGANSYQTMIITDPATSGGALRSISVNSCR